jgi:hypothetical protein
MTKLDETLKFQSFSRVSKVFIEYEAADAVAAVENGLVEKFNESKFSYALDAIANMIQMTVYLPSEEQCDIFKRKTERHIKYIELQRHKIYMDDLASFNDVQSSKSNNAAAVVHTTTTVGDDIESPSSNNLHSLTVDSCEFNYISPIADSNSKLPQLNDNLNSRLQNGNHHHNNNKYDHKSLNLLVFDDNENIESMISSSNDEALSEYKRSENLTIDDNTSSSMSTMSFQYSSSCSNCNQDDLPHNLFQALRNSHVSCKIHSLVFE